MLETASERVRAADEFRVSAAPRLDALENMLSQVQSSLDGKEERAAVVERMQAIYGELQNRVELDWVQRKLETPLEELTKRLEVLQCDVTLLHPQNVAASLRELQETVQVLKLDQQDRLRKFSALETMVCERVTRNCGDGIEWLKC